MDSTYNPPLSLTIIGTIFIGLTALVAAWITFDIFSRRGWETMMAVMIPVYILNALYLAPITLWTYLKYGRPVKPVKTAKAMDMSGVTKEEISQSTHESRDMNGHDHTYMQNMTSGDHGNHHHMPEDFKTADGGESATEHHTVSGMNHDTRPLPSEKPPAQHHDMSHISQGAMHNIHMPSPDQPMFPTVTIAVCHCGAGCLLGDIVGEWLIFGANIMINGRSIWPEFLIDYAFALLFGIFFQYFAIAPMTGDYGPKTLWRAAKADFLSLTFFEIGLFGWMAIFQFAIFDEKLGMDNVVYWWMI